MSSIRSTPQREIRDSGTEHYEPDRTASIVEAYRVAAPILAGGKVTPQERATLRQAATNMNAASSGRTLLEVLGSQIDARLEAEQKKEAEQHPVLASLRSLVGMVAQPEVLQANDELIATSLDAMRADGKWLPSHAATSKQFAAWCAAGDVPIGVAIADAVATKNIDALVTIAPYITSEIDLKVLVRGCRTLTYDQAGSVMKALAGNTVVSVDAILAAFGAVFFGGIVTSKECNHFEALTELLQKRGEDPRVARAAAQNLDHFYTESEYWQACAQLLAKYGGGFDVVASALGSSYSGTYYSVHLKPETVKLLEENAATQNPSDANAIAKSVRWVREPSTERRILAKLYDSGVDLSVLLKAIVGTADNRELAMSLFDHPRLDAASAREIYNSIRYYGGAAYDLLDKCVSQPWLPTEFLSNEIGYLRRAQYEELRDRLAKRPFVA